MVTHVSHFQVLLGVHCNDAYLYTLHTSLILHDIVHIISLSSLTEGSSQQCCYDTSGNLVVGSPNGGTVQSISEETSFSQHFVSDTLQFILCCKTGFPQCSKYYEKRPSDDGSEFNPIPPGTCYSVMMVFCEELDL